MKLKLLALPLLFTVAGCNPYWERTDTVVSGAGNSVAANMAIQTIDPWPANSRNTRIPMEGERAQRAYERYRTNAVVEPSAGAGASSGSGSAGASR